MMESRLRNQLGQLERALRRTRLWRELAFCWAAAAALGVILLLAQSVADWNSRLSWLLPPAAAAAALVGAIERDHPEARHLLSAAAEQEPDPDSGRFGFLQMRVIDRVLLDHRWSAWRLGLRQQFTRARNQNLGALAGLVAVMLFLGYGSLRGRPVLGRWLPEAVTVIPGDAQVERGTGLVITARFGSRPPPEATLVLQPASGPTRRLPLERQLADPVFGIHLPEIDEDCRYHVEYGAAATSEYTITVFDYPALLKADASLQYPAYTGLTNRTIRDTRRITAVEGTRLTYVLQFNKPVARARLAGYRTGLAAAAIEVDERLVVRTTFDRQGGALGVDTLLAGEAPFTALCAANDQLALGALERLRTLGIAVPDEVSVAGFDDISMAAMTAPSLSTVRLPLREMGRLAFAYADRVLAGEDGSGVIMPTEVVLRESTAAPPIAPLPVPLANVVPRPASAPAVVGSALAGDPTVALGEEITA